MSRKNFFFCVSEGGSCVVLGRNEFCVKVTLEVPQREVPSRLGREAIFGPPRRFGGLMVGVCRGGWTRLGHELLDGLQDNRGEDRILGGRCCVDIKVVRGEVG